MKKLLCIILAVVLTCALGVSAFPKERVLRPMETKS